MSTKNFLVTAMHSYNAARAESIERMQQRYHTLVFYLTFVGAIFSVAYGRENPREEILLIVPFIGFGIAIFVTQHHIMMIKLGSFCTNELTPFLKEYYAEAPHWDDSNTFRGCAYESARLRFGGHLLVVVAPSVLALFSWVLGIVNKMAACKVAITVINFFKVASTCKDLPDLYLRYGQFLLWLIGWFFVFFTIRILNYSHRVRMEDYDSRWQRDQNRHNFFRELWIFIKFLFRGDFDKEGKKELSCLPR